MNIANPKSNTLNPLKPAMNNFPSDILTGNKVKKNPSKVGFLYILRQNISFLIIFLLLGTLGAVFFSKFRSEYSSYTYLRNLKPTVLNINPEQTGCYLSLLEIKPEMRRSIAILALEISSEQINGLPLNKILRNLLYELKVTDIAGKSIYSCVYYGQFTDSGAEITNKKILDIDSICSLPPDRYVLQIKIISPLKPFLDCQYRMLLRKQINAGDFTSKINLYRSFSILLFAAALITLTIYLLFTLKLILLNMAAKPVILFEEPPENQ